MKFKKSWLFLLILIFTFIIYHVGIDKKIYYISIGDFLAVGIEDGGILKDGYNSFVVEYLNSLDKLEYFTNDFSNTDMRIVDLKKMINNNDYVIDDGKTLTIKNALVKSDLLVISVGMNDILYKINNLDDNIVYKYLNEIIIDMDETLNLLRNYCKEDIILIGYYDTTINEKNEYINYINSKISNLVSYYDIHFIDTNNIINKSNLDTDIYLDSTNYELIAKTIKEYIENEILR